MGVEADPETTACSAVGEGGRRRRRREEPSPPAQRASAERRGRRTPTPATTPVSSRQEPEASCRRRKWCGRRIQSPGTGNWKPVLGPWASLEWPSPCQGEDREFKSRRARQAPDEHRAPLPRSTRAMHRSASRCSAVLGRWAPPRGAHRHLGSAGRTGSGGRDRTGDLQVMGLARYLFSTPRQ